MRERVLRSSGSRRSSVPLPVEVLGEIFSHCDQQTLGRVSRVSFDCLALSAALLYTDITLSSPKAIANLMRVPHPSDSDWPLHLPEFGVDVPRQPPTTRTSPYTARSRMHSLTYVGLRPDDFGFVNLLGRTPRCIVPVLVVSGLSSGAYSIAFDASRSLFNPVTFIALGSHPGPDPSWWPVLDLDEAYQPWTRLKTVVLCGVQLGDYTQLHHEDISDPIRLFIDLTRTDPEQEHDQPETALDGVGTVYDDIHSGSIPGDEDPYLSPQFWVESQAMKKEVEEIFHFDTMSAAAQADTCVSVPSPRLRQLMDEIVLGVHKRMDWAALDETGSSA